jgi:DNA replication protein DnaC
LITDELGYLPPDKRGAELLFQVISKRYEHGSIIITTNIAFKHWPRIFAGVLLIPWWPTELTKTVHFETGRIRPFSRRRSHLRNGKNT